MKSFAQGCESYWNFTRAFEGKHYQRITEIKHSGTWLYSWETEAGGLRVQAYSPGLGLHSKTNQPTYQTQTTTDPSLEGAAIRQAQIYYVIVIFFIKKCHLTIKYGISPSALYLPIRALSEVSRWTACRPLHPTCPTSFTPLIFWVHSSPHLLFKEVLQKKFFHLPSHRNSGLHTTPCLDLITPYKGIILFHMYTSGLCSLRTLEDVEYWFIPLGGERTQYILYTHVSKLIWSV